MRTLDKNWSKVLGVDIYNNTVIVAGKNILRGLSHINAGVNKNVFTHEHLQATI